MGFEVRDVRPEEREECLELWCRVWSEGQRAFFHRYLYKDSNWKPHYTQVGVLDGKIVSAVQIVRRTVWCGEVQLTMGGLANVSTLPEYRGKGFNTACLKRALAIMEAEEMDFSALGTGIPEYYERIGYTVFPILQTEGSVRKPQSSFSHAELKVREATEADLPAIRAIHAEYNLKRPITVVRTPEYWSQWMGLSEGQPPKDFLVAADAGGQVVGYLRFANYRHQEQPGCEIQEMGWRDRPLTEQQKTVSALLQALCERENASYLRIVGSLEPVLEAALAQILQNREQDFNRGGMLRLLHRTHMLTKLLPTLSHYWENQGQPEGAAYFATPYGPIAFVAKHKRLALEPVENSPTLRSQQQLFRLLFGTLSPSQIEPEGTDTAFLKALFPPQKPFAFYSADWF